MEAFTLLKFWGGGGAALANARASPPTSTTTIADAVSQPEMETEDDDDDDGPFFDLEFTVPDDGDGEDNGDDEEEEGFSDDERGFDFSASSCGSEGRSDRNLALSPSDGLFFKGKLLPLDPLEAPSSRPPQFAVSLLRSATKFRIFLLGFKKPKPPVEASGPAGSPRKRREPQSRSFTVKLKVEEVPIVSLFTRDNSTRSSAGKPRKRPAGDAASSDGGLSSSDARRFARIVVQKYLKMFKPLYVRVSRRYGEKLRFSGQLSQGSGKSAAAPAVKPEAEPAAAPAPATVKNQRQGNLPAGLRVVCRHLGKSRSASASVAAAPWQSQRRDDSLLQQQDGIQSAIAHCKRSFNASKESEISLARCSSDPSADGIMRSSMTFRF